MEGQSIHLRAVSLPLSPLRQLSFLVLLHDMIARQAQFIIAAHSPILMAYGDLDHVRIARGFLDRPGRYLARLFEET